MPSNPTLPEAVKRQASILLRNHMLGMELPDDECDDCIDLIAPLIIEWTQKDQAEKDAVLSESFGMISKRNLEPYWEGHDDATDKIAQAIRAQFPETPDATTGEPDGTPA